MKNSLSLPLLLAVAGNAGDRSYPRGKLLREVMLALGLSRSQLAYLLGVRPGTLNAWLAPSNPRTVPDYVLRPIYELLLGYLSVAEATAAFDARAAQRQHPAATVSPTNNAAAAGRFSVAYVGGAR